ncbi:V8-like Glu-specific endopeptidase [Rhodococcus sp. AG1013]|nr:V8-like Glu-specific endopeptidase [Rhodococcus sp. AG1013]
MRRMLKIAAAAAGAVSLVLVPTLPANAETDTPNAMVVQIPEALDDPAPVLSQSELELDPDFQAYLQQEQQYQQTVQTAPTVASPDSGGAGQVSARSTNPVETRHDGVGALYFTAVAYSYRSCTANYIGGKFWLTADHCVRTAPWAPGFIQQSDGQFAGIENIYRINQPNVDLALIKVGSGISATPFSLSTRTPTISDTLKLVGYSGINNTNTPQNFSSSSTLDYEYHIPSITFVDGSVFNDLSSFTATDYPTCKGDSGGAYFSGGSMFGVHTGQGVVVSQNTIYNCTNWSMMTNLTPYIPWIQNIMATQSQSNLGEIARAFTGGVGANLPFRNAGYAPNIGYIGS